MGACLGSASGGSALGLVQSARCSHPSLFCRQLFLETVTHNEVTHVGSRLRPSLLVRYPFFVESHFASLFRQSMSTTPHKYVMRQRGEQARHLLEQSRLPLIDIAAHCGFQDQSQFTTSFRRYFGMSRANTSEHLELSSSGCCWYGPASLCLVRFSFRLAAHPKLHQMLLRLPRPSPHHCLCSTLLCQQLPPLAHLLSAASRLAAR